MVCLKAFIAKGIRVGREKGYKGKQHSFWFSRENVELTG